LKVAKFKTLACCICKPIEEFAMAVKTKKHPMSVSATQLSQLGQCELMVAYDLIEVASPELNAASERGNAEHDRFHLRAVLNSGTATLARKL
jgi:hypothetical protein